MATWYGRYAICDTPISYYAIRPFRTMHYARFALCDMGVSHYAKRAYRRVQNADIDLAKRRYGDYVLKIRTISLFFTLG